jgi:intracellular septation protein
MNNIEAEAAAHVRRPRPARWLKFAVEFGPLILFFTANARPKLFAPFAAPFLPAQVLSGPNGALLTATLVLMAAVAAALCVSFAVTRKLPAVPLATAVLVAIFGGLTLYLQDTAFIKMKPTVLYAAFGLVLIAGLSMNKSLLRAAFENSLDLPERGWRLLTFRWAGFFFVLAALNEVIWRTQSNDTWVAFKFPGISILILLFSLAQIPLIKRHGLPQEEAERAPDDY